MITALKRVLNNIPNGLMRFRFSHVHRPFMRVGLPVLLSFGIAVMGIGLGTSPSLAIAVADVPNPRELNGGWVTDMADLLSDEGEQQLNQIIGELEASSGAEIAVVTVLDTQPSASPKAFATELFNTWGIGKAGEDNGVLFLVSKNERRTEVETGYGAEAVLPDAKVGQILREQVTPQFKQGNFEVGILAGTSALVEGLNGATFASPTAPMESRAPFPAGKALALICAVGAIAIAPFFSYHKHRHWHFLSPRGDQYIKPQSKDRLLKLFWSKISWFRPEIEAGESARRPQDILVADHYQLMLMRSLEFVIPSILILLIASGLLFGFKVSIFWSAILIGGWSIAEALHSAWCHGIRSPGELLKEEAFGLILGAGILTFITAPLSFFSAIFVISLGTVTAAIRLLKLWPIKPLACKQCRKPFTVLDAGKLSLHLSQSQKIAQTIGSTTYQGIRCETCTGQDASNSNLKLLIHLLDEDRFSRCPELTCRDALTMTYRAKLLKSPSYVSEGLKQVHEHCQCCGLERDRQVTLKQWERSAFDNRNSYGSTSSGSFSSNGSESASSGGGSSGSSSYASEAFGGGESGGGGAGESW